MILGVHGSSKITRTKNEKKNIRKKEKINYSCLYEKYE